MTKRLWGGVLLSAMAILAFTMTAEAVRPDPKPYKGSGAENPMINHELPLFLRSAAETCWVPVHPAFSSPCPTDGPWNTRNGITADEVWCFEGAGGDSSWPLHPGEDWDHWSIFDPPGGGVPKWHLTNRQTNPSGGGTYNAYCGCDSVANAATGQGFCPETAFWIFQRGYGDDWNYSLALDYSGGPFLDGGTIGFDIRYDVECLYDYVYLEYLNQGTGEWEVLTDNPAGGGDAAIFNAVSGNPQTGSARACGADYFGNSDQDASGDPVYGGGNSGWHTASFPVPNIAVMGGSGTNLDLRWRGFSDGAWSDADGSDDTDGMGAIDNVTITLPTPTPGAISITDNFESNANQVLEGRTASATSGTATWHNGGLEGTTYDGWHLLYDPLYPNVGNTCTFSDDWMWSAKPQGEFPPDGSANGFRMYLVSPAISTDGWTGGIVQYTQYLCMPSKKEDYINTHARWYDTSGSWSLWNDFDGFITFEGCEFWNVNDGDVLTPYLGASVESLQVAWECLDITREGENAWNKHGSVQYFVDNVSFGSFDGTATVFTARVIDIFADTFSRVDPSHTPFLANSQQGDWSGNGGSRDFASDDSMTVTITDVDGLANVAGTPSNVSIYFRHDSATGPTTANQVWTNWVSKPMDLSVPDNFNAGWGDYRMIFGQNSGVGFNAGGEDGDPGNSPFIWTPGTTIQYYVKVIDDGNSEATFPGTADDSPPAYFEWSVLPFFVRTDGTKAPFDGIGQASIHILLVDDFTRNALDFENSTGYVANGGAGGGDFTDAVFDQPEDMVERALSMLYGGSEGDGDAALYDPHWDKYDVQGAGSSVQCEPRGRSSLPNIGGYGSDLGVPNYDAIVWLNGTFDEYSYADTTRIELSTYLNNGGKLFGCGDDVVFHLDPNGNDADSTVQFVQNYMGCDLPTSVDDETVDRTLSVVGVAGSSMAGIELGIYGECPIRRSFDRMTTSTPTGGTATRIMNYAGGDASDNGKAAIIKCRRNAAPNGVSVHAAFDVSALLSDDARACLLDAVFTTDFGLPATAYGNCTQSGVDAPLAGRFGYDLSRATPNPFHSETAIKFSVPTRQHVSIEVYNILGQKVRTLVDETRDANSYVEKWDGRSDAGAQVSSGIYFYKMVAGDYTQTQKTVLLK